MIFGHFIEHFHRQIYGGVYDPGNPLSDEDGFRRDVIEAMKKIKVPILRWPGGCFVSAYNWKKAVGSNRTAYFDKAWRVQEPNEFGTDEFVKMCEKIGCEPYICTNAGTGTAEEMSDWVEYCNLESDGEYAKQRIENGYEKPHNVKYWSVGNENYGSWEVGAKDAKEWGRLVLESSKMMKRIDPEIELSAAALTDIDWNMELLKAAKDQLDWISIHEYWDQLHDDNTFSDYGQVVALTQRVETSINKVRGLLCALGLENRIKIAFDEWNLRSWHHPKAHTALQGVTKEDYLYPRDKNDRNEDYTIADAIFSACFLNACLKNCDIVGMANFAPIVNTRGCIYTHNNGIVLRSTYHVFEMYVNLLGATILDSWCDENITREYVAKDGECESVELVDVVATLRSDGCIVLAVVNKNEDSPQKIIIELKKEYRKIRVHTLGAPDTHAYNDINVTAIEPLATDWMSFGGSVDLPIHSVSIIEIMP